MCEYVCDMVNQIIGIVGDLEGNLVLQPSPQPLIFWPIFCPTMIQMVAFYLIYKYKTSYHIK